MNNREKINWEERSEQCLRDLQNNNSRSNIPVMSSRRGITRAAKKAFEEIMAENFPKLENFPSAYRFKMMSKPHTGITQRNWCQDIS